MEKLIDKGMQIDLGKGKWRLSADALNYILLKRVGQKKPRYVVEGYYHTIEDMLERILESELMDSQVKSLTALKKLIRTTKADIKGYALELEEKLKK